MDNGYIAGTAKEFIDKLNRMKNQLSAFSGETDIRRDEVFMALNNFANASKKVIPQIEGDQSNLQKAMLAAVDELNDSIDMWNKHIELNKKGTKFMKEHEKSLMIMIFGAVKSGKSSLGNFIAGKNFLEANFDNAYKHLGPTKFGTIDVKRSTGGLQTDDKGNQWFSEGVLDTTGNIQFFTLAGMRWIDSPGTGAIAKDTDKQDGRTMDQMVKEYIPYTDMCIFLQNSGEPGLQEDMQFIKLLDKENQTALVVISKSDEPDEDEDEDGNIITCWRAKTADARKDQEEYVLSQIKETCPEVSANKYAVLPISTYLAQQGIKNNDEESYKSSNLDKLMQIIGDKASEDVIAFKERKPKININAFITGILHGSDNEICVDTLVENFNGIKENIDGCKAKLEKKRSSIKRNVEREVELIIKKNLRLWGKEVEKNRIKLTDTEISKRIIKLVMPVLSQSLNEAIGNVIESYREQTIMPMALEISGGGLQKKVKIIEHTYDNVYYEERDPDGFFEHVASFFGKTYYARRVKQEKVSETIDMGSNINEFVEKVLPTIKNVLENHIDENIDRIKDTYFAPQEQYVESMQVQLQNLRDKLESFKYAL